jgi:UDP-N-acetylglucosamine 2-epimerase (non-hydrolysing)
LLKKLNPDCLLILGDTDSCLSSLSAKRLKIPIFHMEAGNRCFDLRTPEEVNRKIVDHISDIHLPYSQQSRNNLIAEGIKPDQIIVVGSPLPEIYNAQFNKVSSNNILKKLSLVKNDYFIISVHRSENVDDPKNINNLCVFLNKLAEHYSKRIILTCHPRLASKMSKLKYMLTKLIEIYEPFDYTSYIKLQKSAIFVMSDSGTLAEEADIIGFKAIWLRNWQERPEAIEEGVLPFTGLNFETIKLIIDNKRKVKSTIKSRKVYDYSSENTSEKIFNIIISYIDYVNRKVWSK